MTTPYKPGRLMRRALYSRLPSRLYDRNLGWLLTGRMCRITHVGRKSGRRYHTVVEVVGTDRRTGAVTVVSGFGAASDWYRNLKANGAAEIETGRRRFGARVHELDTDEAIAVLAAYEHRNRLAGPFVRHMLGKLAGWRYDGSDTARRKFAEQLPMITFEPESRPVN